MSDKYIGKEVEIHSTHSKPMRGVLLAIQNPLVTLQREEDGRPVLIPLSMICHILVTETITEKPKK